MDFHARLARVVITSFIFMLSVFFNKSKPIHYILLSVVLLCVYIVVMLRLPQSDLSALMVIERMGNFIVILVSVLVFNFIVTKNKLTKKNSFKMLLYLAFIAILPVTLLNPNILLANLFLIFALRRILSLRTQKDIKKKLFDAAFWIALASLCYFWCILFFILLFAALLVYSFTDIKNYIIPIIGLITVVVLSISYRIIADIYIFENIEAFMRYDFDFSTLNSKRVIIGATVLFSFGLWSLFYYIKNIKSKMKSNRPTFRLIVISAILSLLIIILAPAKNGSEFLFLFAPLAIIITNYLEIISDKWFKEIFLWLLVLTPIVILVL